MWAVMVDSLVGTVNLVSGVPRNDAGVLNTQPLTFGVHRVKIYLLISRKSCEHCPVEDRSRAI